MNTFKIILDLKNYETGPKSIINFVLQIGEMTQLIQKIKITQELRNSL